jgi:hypothetical protein
VLIALVLGGLIGRSYVRRREAASSAS